MDASDIHLALQDQGFDIETVVLAGTRDRDPSRTLDVHRGGQRIQVVLREPVSSVQQGEILACLESLSEGFSRRTRLRVVYPALDPVLEPRVEFHRLRKPLSREEGEQLLERLRRLLPEADFCLEAPSAGGWVDA